METSSPSSLSDDGGRSSSSSSSLSSSSSSSSRRGGCVAIATTPGSTSSGYWSTNDDDDDDDDLSRDVISASLGFDPTSMIGYGGCCWMPSPNYDIMDDNMQLDDEDEVGFSFDVETSTPEDQGLGLEDQGLGPEVRFHPGVGMDLGPEVGGPLEIPLEMKVVALESGLLVDDSDVASADFGLDLTMGPPESRPEVDCEGLVTEVVEKEPEMSLAATRSSLLLADFLFCDWLQQGSTRSTPDDDRMFEEFISGDVFPVDAFDGGPEELEPLVDDSRWKVEEVTGSPRELDRGEGGSLSGDLDEERTTDLDEHGIFLTLGDDSRWNFEKEEEEDAGVTGSPRDLDLEERTDLDEHGIFLTNEALSFDLIDPVDPFESYHPDSHPISPLSPLDRISLDRCCCYETPETEMRCTSGCASPLDVAVASPTDFRCCPDSGELFDVLLCEVVRHPTPDVDVGPEALPVKPELVLVATPSASSKRKLSDLEDAGNQPSRKTPRVEELEGCCGAAGNQRIELPVTLVQVTSSACDRPSGGDGSRHVGVIAETGKTQDVRTSGEFPHAGIISHAYSEFPSETNNESERLRLKKPDATENDDDGGACAVRKAEVLAAMLQAEAVLREPNRGSDVIFAELRSRKSLDPRSPCGSLVPSSPSPFQPRGASSSLRSFLIRKQRDSSASGQNLLHRLLKGETSEAEVRREQAAASSGQTTRKIAVAEKS